jgi:N-acetylneuraminate synthase/N,N'-diacetyllegionaminate synthase
MIIGNRDTDKNIFIIAEIGANHEGSFDEAVKLIKAAADAGVDAVKFQTYRAEKIMASTETQRLQHFKRLELTNDEFIKLAEITKGCGLIFLSTPFDIQSVDMLDPLMPAFKIASGDLTCHPLVRQVASKGKPVLLSTGMANENEIGKAVQAIKETGNNQIVLLHCVSSYPTPPEEANLNAIKTLSENFSVTVGYSDHTLGILACTVSAALGARVIEKHFTLDKTRTTFRDHQLSADPDDMRMLVSQVRDIGKMLGNGDLTLSKAEESNICAMRRSLAALIDIPLGAVIQRNMITFLRPATGIRTEEIKLVVDRKAKRDIKRGNIISWDDLS